MAARTCRPFLPWPGQGRAIAILQPLLESDAVLKIELDNQEHRITKISGGAIKVVVHGEELSL